MTNLPGNRPPVSFADALTVPVRTVSRAVMMEIYRKAIENSVPLERAFPMPPESRSRRYVAIPGLDLFDESCYWDKSIVLDDSWDWLSRTFTEIAAP